MNFLQPQCSDEDCCGNGIDGSSCTPQAWVNACSIGWYLTDRCELDILFRIKKDGAVIVGPSTAFSYSMTPPDDEVADYAVEYCIGPEPCTWIVVWEAEVDTTVEDACPMGVQGQAYILSFVGSDTAPQPVLSFYWCHSFIVVRAAAMAAPGQVITHLWIDDRLFTPNTNYAGAISDDDAITAQTLCNSGIGFSGPAGVGYNNTTYPQLRIELPIPFTKGSFSVRAKQTDGTIVGCTVDIPHCSVHYNAASVTLPTWGGLSLSCGETGAMPFGYMSTPAPVRFWCQSYESTIEISGGLSGLIAFYTCYSTSAFFQVPIETLTCTYNFKCDGAVRWVDSGGTIHSGTYSFDHTVTWNTRLVFESFSDVSPGEIRIDGIIAVIISDVVSTITGHNDFYDAVGASLLEIDWLSALNITGVTNNQHTNGSWFISELLDGLNCYTPTPDEEVFQWKWQGPQLSSEYWGVEIAEMFGGVIAPSPIIGTAYMSAVWPADTSFACNLPEGSYYDETESASISQFQV